MKRRTKRDMISDLPEGITGHILGRMPIQDAVRTSILSNKWRYKWTLIRDLTFGKQFLNYLEGEKYMPHLAYYMIINHLLENKHEGNINSFTLYVPDSDSQVLSYLQSILHVVSLKDVKQVNIVYESPPEIYKEDDYMNLWYLYHCLKMTNLTMTNCGIFRPPTFNGFPNLVSLRCESVTFSSGSFTHLFSKCPLIEYLSLIDCYGPDTFDICSTRLKHLEVSVPSKIMIKINTPDLETLHVCTPTENDGVLYSYPIRIMTALNSLKNLVFGCFFFQYLKEVSPFVSFIRAAPNFRVLDVVTGPGFRKEASNILKTTNQKLENLETVIVTIWDGGDDEMFLIKCLLALTPSLEEIIIDMRYDADVADITAKLAGFLPDGEIEIEELPPYAPGF